MYFFIITFSFIKMLVIFYYLFQTEIFTPKLSDVQIIMFWTIDPLRIKDATLSGHLHDFGRTKGVPKANCRGFRILIIKLWLVFISVPLGLNPNGIEPNGIEPTELNPHEIAPNGIEPTELNPRN